MYLHFYVYAYLRKDGTPYYIGKGSGNRAYKHSNTDKIHPPIDVSNIVFLKENISETEAFAYEKQMISHYGRKDLGTGILRNMTNGGEGTAGYKHTSEFRKRISSAQKGNTNGAHSKGIIRNHTNKDKWRENISLAKRGIAKLKLECPHCGKIGGEPQMKQWHFANCKTINTIKG